MLLRTDEVRSAVARAMKHHRRHTASIGGADVDAVVAAVAQSEGIKISVRDAHLPLGYYGRWLRSADGSEVFEVSTGLASRDWTIAHELGHLMLRHYVDSDERGCRVDDPFAEYQAERFAALLTSRLAVARRAPRDAVFS